MQRFIYPRDYLSKRGSVKACWEAHKEKMKEGGLPYVDYNAFYARLRRQGWVLYKAIHTPLDTRKLVWYEKIWVAIRTEWFRFIYLFKRDDMRRGEGHKNSG